MKEVTVIIHGWSDSSKSFEKLKKLLTRKGFGSVRTILYADYESREDNMTFEDVADGLNDQFIRHGFIGADGRAKVRMNVIVHSTGGLVIRHWIWRYYALNEDRIAECPVKRIVMLAPANFGSPLAHRGKSFFPSLVKGRWRMGDFLETGKQILDGLELGSPYQWRLAHGDLIRKKPYFVGDRIQTTIMVGIEGYGGVAKVVNQPGTDGTVVISGTSLDSAKLILDFTKPRIDARDYIPYEWEIEHPSGDFAFGVLEGLDHGKIVKAVADENSLVSRLLQEALRIRTPKQFDVFQETLEKVTESTYQRTGKPQFQQFLVHAIDDQGISIKDYTLDFFLWKADGLNAGGVISKDRLSRRELHFSQMVHDAVTEQFHTHSRDTSHRSFLVNLRALEEVIAEARREFGSEVVMSMRLFVPKIDDGIKYDTEGLQNIALYHSDDRNHRMPKFFFPNTTTLLELCVNRYNTYVTLGIQPRKH